MTAHSVFSASSSARWTKCAAAIRMSLGIEGTTNPSAELGTAAHELGEFCLRMGINSFDCMGIIFNNHVVDEAMCDAVQLYIAFIRDLCRKYNVDPMLEKRVYMTSVGDDVFGTSDCIVVVGDHMFVIDYKHGYGVVEVENNTQAIFYVIATLDTLNLWNVIKHVHTHIIQPRANHVDGAIRSHSYTIDQMVAWQAFFKQTVENARKADSGFVAGDHCKYCPARGHCRVRIMHTLHYAYFDKSLEVMTDEEISIIYNEISSIKTNIEAIAAKATDLARNGATIEGHKLVKSITRAVCEEPDKFVEEAIAAGVKRSALFDEKLKSMTNVKKIVNDKLVNKHFIKPPASTTLVELSNNRPAVSVAGKTAVGRFAPVK